MSHSIEELTRQHEAAKSRLANARAKVSKSERALTDALIDKAQDDFARRGIPIGQKVSVTDVSWDGRKTVNYGFYVGHKPSRYQGNNIEPDIPKIKKDGTASSVRLRVYGSTTIEPVK